MLPGRIYPDRPVPRVGRRVLQRGPVPLPRASGTPTCTRLRSDGQTGLALVGLWHVLCHWLLKARHPDEMVDVPPSELAWHYIRETERWVVENGKRNTVRRGDFAATLGAVRADAVYLAPPGRSGAKRIDARVWMWEAWWQGDPYLNVERLYRDTVFGGTHQRRRELRPRDRRSAQRGRQRARTSSCSRPTARTRTFRTPVKRTAPHVEIVAPNDRRNLRHRHER